MTDLLNISYEDLSKEITALGYPRYRADQIYASLHKNNVGSINDITNIPPSMKADLNKRFTISKLKLIKTTDSSDYRTKKFLFEIDSAQGISFIEAVLISENGRDTICLSTQVGCNVGCEFCATGKMGFKKNLQVSEIISQVYAIKKTTGLNPTNIVYMGMGEPFLNYDNMIKSLKILTHTGGLNLPSKRITVSTVGFKGKINRFADDLSQPGNESIKKVKLALSLHSTDNGFREAIIPTSVKNKLPDLYKELSYFYQKTGNKITYEYIFFEGLNDSDNDVRRLQKLSRMVPSNLNIIPFHPIDYELRKPLHTLHENKDINKLLSNEKLFDFIAKLKNQKMVINVRSSSGIDINAACGQLAVTQSKSNS